MARGGHAAERRVDVEVGGEGVSFAACGDHVLDLPFVEPAGRRPSREHGEDRFADSSPIHELDRSPVAQILTCKRSGKARWTSRVRFAAGCVEERGIEEQRVALLEQGAERSSTRNTSETPRDGPQGNHADKAANRGRALSGRFRLACRNERSPLAELGQRTAGGHWPGSARAARSTGSPCGSRGAAFARCRRDRHR